MGIVHPTPPRPPRPPRPSLGLSNMSAGLRATARGRLERAALQVGPWRPGVAPWASALASAPLASARWGPRGCWGWWSMAGVGCLMAVLVEGAGQGVCSGPAPASLIFAR